MSARADSLAHLRLASEIAGMRVDEVGLPRDEHLAVEGLRLHYLDWGTPGQPALLFLHGGRLTAHTWDLVCLALRSDFHCLALDQRGHGDSDWSPSLDYGPETNARDIGAWIDHLGAREAVLIGQSLGGLHAITYATANPERIAALVLVDVAPGVREAGAQRIVDFAMSDPGPGSMEEFLERALAFNPRRDPRLLRRSLLHNLRRLPDGRFTWKHDPGRLTREYFESTKASVERLGEVVGTITCPVLVVRGGDSDVLGDEQAARFAASLPCGGWTRIPLAGHNVQGDNPRALVQALERFLAELSPLLPGQDVASARSRLS